MSIAQKKDNENSLHYLFPVFMRFLCLFCMMFHMFEGEYIQELFCSLCLRMFEKFIGSGLLHDLTLVDENNFVRYRLCKLHLMGDNEHGLALFCQIQHNIQHFSYHLRIQCRGHFIEK